MIQKLRRIHETIRRTLQQLQQPPSLATKPLDVSVAVEARPLQPTAELLATLKTTDVQTFVPVIEDQQRGAFRRVFFGGMLHIYDGLVRFAKRCVRVLRRLAS